MQLYLYGRKVHEVLRHYFSAIIYKGFWMRSYLTLLLILLFSDGLYSHGDLHARIENLTRKIAVYPHDAQLYQQRGELHLQHEQYKRAIKDFRFYQKKRGVQIRTSYCLARAYFGMGAYRKSLKLLHNMEESEYKLQALSLMADIYLQKELHLKAGESYAKVINLIPIPSVQNYLDAAESYHKANQLGKAIWVLQQGLDRLGPTPSITKTLIHWYRLSGQYDAAIALHNLVIRYSNRKEYAYYDRALTRYYMGDINECQQDIDEAKSLIAALPLHLRNTPATSAFKNKLNRMQYVGTLH